MTIPRDWLDGPITIAEVEERLADEMAPDCWLEQWHALLRQLRPGDELREYYGSEFDDPGSESRVVIDWQQGYALVRNGEIVDAIAHQFLPWA